MVTILYYTALTQADWSLIHMNEADFFKALNCLGKEQSDNQEHKNNTLRDTNGNLIKPKLPETPISQNIENFHCILSHKSYCVM